MELDENNMVKLPVELVHIIADYHDYEKYCLPSHKRHFRYVIDDIKIMSGIIQPNLSPSLAYLCWGTGWNSYTSNWDIVTEDIEYDM